MECKVQPVKTSSAGSILTDGRNETDIEGNRRKQAFLLFAGNNFLLLWHLLTGSPRFELRDEQLSDVLWLLTR